MRGYDAQTLSRLARHDLADPIPLDHFLTRCTRASKNRYEIADPGHWKYLWLLPFAAAVVVAAWISWACISPVVFVAAIVPWLTTMAVTDIRITQSTRRARRGQCAVCAYQITPPTTAAPDPATPPPLATTTTCPECGNQTILPAPAVPA